MHKLFFRISILLTTISLIITFQQCSNVELLQESSIVGLTANKLKGRFCFPYNADQYSNYKLSDLYIINLTLRAKSDALHPDSNMNGEIDSEEITGAKTVFVSKKDTDSDGLPDFIEKLKGLNPSRNDLNEDGYDLDEVSNKREIQLGTDPNSKNQTPEALYSVKEASDNSFCGDDQKAYTFEINQIPTVKTNAFSDSVNLANTLNLSHEKDENVYLIMAKVIPENTTNDTVFLTKLFKHSITEAFAYDFSPKDFFILDSSENVDCNNCSPLEQQNKYLQITTGLFHACALTATGKVYCWGNNSYGQLGDGSFSPRLVPTQVKISAEVKMISSGQYHNCAITKAAEVFCWGSNEYGQLGNSNNKDSNTPTKIETLGSAAKLISSGNNHSCAELASNTIKCWGNNNNFQLGNGTAVSSSLPLQTANMSKAPTFPLKSMTAGADHNCLVDNLGQAFCWGGFGGCTEQKIDLVPTHPTCGTSPSTSTTIFPNETSDLYSTIGRTFNRAAWSQIVTNGSVNYGIHNYTAPSKIYCWGSQLTSLQNLNLGCAERSDGTTSYESAGISNVLKLSMAMDKTCSITKRIVVGKPSESYNTLDCWGKPFDSDIVQSSPLTVTELKNPIDVAVSHRFICAIDSDGVIWCWGQNTYGQLGINSIVNTFNPTKVIQQ